MKKLSLFFIAVLAAFSLQAAAPSGYYSSLNGLCGAQLKKAAKAKVASHKAISYGSGTWDAFRETDTREVNGKLVWWDMYSNGQVSVSSGHDGLNIEHSVANSWWGKTKNDAYKDLFHLNPSESKANSAKGNFPLGEIAGTPSWTNGVTNVGSPVSGQGGGSNKVYEPHDDYKGDFARVFMYMFTVYDNISWKSNTDWMYDTSSDLMFKPWAVELLLRWHHEDPVSPKEIARNEAIYKIQGNRNPYIDMPDLADHIWGAKSNEPFKVDGAGDPNPDPDPDLDKETVLLFCDFDQSQEISHYTSLGWENYVERGDLSGWFIKQFSGNNYASASAYKGTADGGPYDEYLYTPELTVETGQKPVLSFRTQGAYGVDGSYMEVYVKSEYDGVCFEKPVEAKICVPNPDGSSPVYSDWVQSGEIDLNQACGEILCKFRVGFRYYSAKGGAGNTATYCLDDVKIVARADSSTVAELPSDAGDVYVCGSDIVAPEGSRVFDLSGSERRPSGLDRGIYIVVTPAGRTAKLIVR